MSGRIEPTDGEALDARAAVADLSTSIGVAEVETLAGKIIDVAAKLGRHLGRPTRVLLSSMRH